MPLHDACAHGTVSVRGTWSWPHNTAWLQVLTGTNTTLSGFAQRLETAIQTGPAGVTPSASQIGASVRQLLG